MDRLDPAEAVELDDWRFDMCVMRTLSPVIVLCAAILYLGSCKSRFVSPPPNDRTIISKALGIDLPPDARNIHTFELSLMASNLWVTFELRDSDVKKIFASNGRLPDWDQFKPSSTTSEEMFKDVIKQVPNWWSLSNKVDALGAELTGTTKGNFPFTTQACTIDLGDGYWRVYVVNDED